VDPVRGDDRNPGTATQPFQTVRYALTTPIVSSAANTIGSGTDGGTDVTVTIVRAETQGVSEDISTPTLDRGSVTVVGPSGFNLNLSNKLLTLNKGYRLQGFKIESGDPGGPGTAKAAITLNAEGTPLKDMVIDCAGRPNITTGITTSNATTVGGGDKCVHVTSGLGTVTLENVDIFIPSNQNFVTGIYHEGRVTLKVTNDSSVEAVGPLGNKQGVVGIYGKTPFGSVEVVRSTVSLSAIKAAGSVTGSNGNVFAVLLSPIAFGRVEGSRIQVREGNSASEIAIGVCVNANASGTVNVQGNRFTNVTNTSPGPTSIAIHRQAGTVVSTDNTFIDFSSSNQYVQSGSSCP
jgi:hypothetical protein